VSKFIAIDLAPEGIFVVAGSTRGQAKVEQAVSWTDADGEAPPVLSAETAKRIGEHLRERLRSAGIGPAPVLVSVGRGRVILKELRYPAVPPAEEPAVVKFQAMKELSDSPDDVVLDYTPLSNGTPEGERRSMAVVIRKELFAAVQQMCTAANLKLAAVTPRPYAIAAGLTRAFAARAVQPPESPSDAVATLVLGSAGGEFTVVRNGEVTFTSDVPGPVVSSEPMLIGDIRRKLTMYAGAAPGHPVQALYVAESAGGWAGRLRAALGLPVSAYDPLNGSVPEVPETLRGRFAGAVGLLAAKAANAVPINFAAPRQPKAEKDPKQGKLLLAVAAALLLLLAGGAYGYMMLSAADDRLADLTKQKTSLEKKVKDLEPDAKRLDAARKWQARRVNWLDELFDMTDRIPQAGGIYVSSFDAKAVAPDAKTGNQTNQARLELKVEARDGKAVDAVYFALHDEPKYYTGASTSPGGQVARAEPGTKEYTIFALVKNRPPEQYTNSPSFAPPNRKNYPPKTSREAPKPEPNPEDASAPPPRDKEKPVNTDDE
jgi:hypothetical protein